MSTAYFKKDEKTGRYIVYAPGRVKRPENIEIDDNKKECPFCPEFRGDIGEVNFEIKGSDGKWRVKSVENKFPITHHHEVIIHNPDHGKTIEKMSEEEVGELFSIYQDRFNSLKKYGQVLIFCNYGKMAGASLDHPHSQIMVVDEGIKFSSVGLQTPSNIIFSSENFDAFAPDYSEYPYEVWIKPKNGGKSFGDEMPDMVKELGMVGKKLLSTLITHLADKDLMQQHSGVPHLTWKDHGVSYNFYIDHGDDYFLRIVPKLQLHGGFELGSGIFVNIVEPTEVASLLSEDILNGR